ncbi:hypothetical protein GCM10022415_22140 [Knoellia locipacati]|uniref:Uncharacterized protein n=1 Tax=Knoellia locipacati TaxID=882824 RepID=A0A512T1U8_9MICO|nr:hypothetical protein [Knoellia locipacati]GEQ14163.1 hypothetical protein KLO01_22100 [Knoellia locipacati]
MSDPILELLAAPPSPALSVDENAVHTGGRRRLRRRNLRRAGLGAGAAVAAAAIAFTPLGSGLGGEALPAGPSTSVDAGRRVSAALFDGDWSVEVRPGAPADQPNIMFYKGSGTSRQQLAGSSADATVVSLGTGSGAEGVMLGTAPADATAFLTITRDGTHGGIETDQQPLPGTAYQAVALKFDDPKEVDSYVDTIWTNADDEVRTATGSLLPSVPTNDGDRFFVAQDASTIGVFMADGSGGSTRPLTTGESTTMGYGQKPDDGEWSWSSVTLLPEGARDVRLEWANATRTTDVTVRSLGSAEVAFAEASAPGAGAGPSVTAVSWTDAAGTRHTEAVK